MQRSPQLMISPCNMHLGLLTGQVHDSPVCLQSLASMAVQLQRVSAYSPLYPAPAVCASCSAFWPSSTPYQQH